MSVIVRTAGRRDLEAIHELWVALREEGAKADSRLDLSADGEGRAREHREVVLADPRTRFFVAEEQGDVLGFLHAQVDTLDPSLAHNRVGTIVDLMVWEGRRREGVGTRLWEGALEWFESLALSEVRADVPEHAESARRFFAARGTDVVATRVAAPLHSAR